MIGPERLQAIVPNFESKRVDYDPALLHDDADALVSLLAAVVIRSGYAWQPSLTREPVTQAADPVRPT
jgi:hypothetical protein